MNKNIFLVYTFLLLSFSGFSQNRMLTDMKTVVRQYEGETFCDQPMSALEFESFRTMLSQINSEELRFEQIRINIHRHCLATPYIFQLMELFTNPTLEYDMLRLSFYYCFDLENYQNLIPYMQGQVFRDRLSSFVNERTYAIRADVEGSRELLSPSELRRALGLIGSFETDQAKIAVAKQFISTNNMRSEQFREVVDLVSLNNGKMDLIYFAYPYVYDPANYYAAYQDLRRKDIAKIDAYMAKQKRPTEERFTSTRELGCTILLSKSEFETHKNGIKGKRFDSERLRFAKNLFNTYCFNVNELKQCMALFKSDSDRQELALYAYSRIYDPWNFYLLGNSFYSESKVGTLFKSLAER